LSKNHYFDKIISIMKIETVKYYHPRLRKKAKEVMSCKEVDELIEVMKEVIKEEDGVGLAAPQIGVSKKVIVIDTGDGPVAFLNPEIIKKSKKTMTTKEGCLSLKGIWLDVVRPRRIRLTALTQEGQKIEIEAEDILAIIFQHEIDHLEGKLFIDRVGFYRKVKALIPYFINKGKIKDD
jgi:peptide deformylase